MEEFITFLLKNYGLAGGLFLMILTFSAYLIHTILSHFIKASDRKDKDLSFLFDRATRAIENNSKAMNEISRTQQKLCSVMNNILENFHMLREQTTSDHQKMLSILEDQAEA